MSERPTAPKLLPPQLPLFVDRRKELDDIRLDVKDSFERASPLRWLVTGAQGIGKTAFATMACHEVSGAYPDGQLYFDVGGSETGSVTADEIAASFLRQMGWPVDGVPVAPAERLGALRDRLSGARVLVLLDDVARADQVVPLLLSSPPAATVVTSRKSLSALRSEGFRSVSLAGLSDEDARELIQKVAGRDLELDPEVMCGVWEVCEGLPLAVSIAAARLTDPDECPETYLRELREGDVFEALELDGQRPVLRVSEGTYRHLDDDAKRAYALLCLLPGPHFGVGVAADVLGVSDGEARKLLRRLVGECVLDRQGSGRYRFHALIRAHARDKARETYGPAEIAAVVARAVRWYWRRQIALDRSITRRPHPLGAQEHYAAIPAAYEGKDAEHLAWTECEVEWPNLVAAMREPGALADAEVSRLFPLALWSFGYQAGQVRELIDAYRRSLESTEDSGERWQMHRDLGGLYEKYGDAERAAAHVALARQCGHVQGSASELEWRGLASEARGECEAALDDFRCAWELVPEMGDGVQEQRSYALLRMHIGRVCGAVGRFAEAETESRAAYEYFDDHDEQLNRALAGRCLGRALLGLERPGDAEPLLRDAYPVLQERQNWENAAKAAHDLALVAEHHGRAEDASRWRELAEELWKRHLAKFRRP